MKKFLSVVGNIIWVIFGGLEMCLAMGFAGIASCFTIIGIPYGLQLFKLSGFLIWPFGKTVKKTNINGFKTFLNVLWAIFAGWELFLTYAFIALLFTITIIGIPYGKIYFRIAKFIIMPLGHDFVKIEKKSKQEEQTENVNSNVSAVNTSSVQTNQKAVAVLKPALNKENYIVNSDIKEKLDKLKQDYEDTVLNDLKKKKELFEFNVITKDEYDTAVENVKKNNLDKYNNNVEELNKSVYDEIKNKLDKLLSSYDPEYNDVILADINAFDNIIDYLDSKDEKTLYLEKLEDSKAIYFKKLINDLQDCLENASQSNKAYFDMLISKLEILDSSRVQAFVEYYDKKIKENEENNVQVSNMLVEQAPVQEAVVENNTSSIPASNIVGLIMLIAGFASLLITVLLMTNVGDGMTALVMNMMGITTIGSFLIIPGSILFINGSPRKASLIIVIYELAASAFVLFFGTILCLIDFSEVVQLFVMIAVPIIISFGIAGNKIGKVIANSEYDMKKIKTIALIAYIAISSVALIMVISGIIAALFGLSYRIFLPLCLITMPLVGFSLSYYLMLRRTSKIAIFYSLGVSAIFILITSILFISFMTAYARDESYGNMMGLLIFMGPFMLANGITSLVFSIIQLVKKPLNE